MNEIQEKLIEMSKEYIKVCEKLNLRYFALAGTILGAVRHKGFIPWDDDIDFCMPDEDYKIFLKEAPKYLPKNYFIQHRDSEKNYFSPYAKIRDSNTTAIEIANKDTDINHGLWVDIFPLYGMPSSVRKCKRLDFIDFEIMRRRYLHYRYKSHRFLGKCVNFINYIICPSKRLAYKITKHYFKKSAFDKSEYVWWGWHKRLEIRLRKEWFDSYIEMPFEDIKVRVPKNYDEYLKAHYGNWEQLPPEEKRVSVHTFYKLDLNTPYTEFYKEK